MERGPAPPDRPRAELRFDGFRLDRHRLELTREGEPVRLHQQPMRLLAFLLERAGTLVTREEIQRHVWPDDTHVDFDQGINAAIRQIRNALGDDAASPRYVQTVPRRGYRFVGTVTKTATEGPRESPGRFRYGWVTALALSLLASLAWLGARPLVADRSAPVGDTRPSLVVLPFQNLGPGAGEDWLGDALTEELIANLGGGYPDRLKVIARTSAMTYRDAPRDVAAIAKELDVDYLLEGSIQRERDALRVTAQLIHAADRSHLWADTYDRTFDDLLALQKDVTREIAAELVDRLIAGSPSPDVERDPDPAAYESVLRGNHFLKERTFDAARKAKAAFEKAIAIAPGYARAHEGLARALHRALPAPEGGRLAVERVAHALTLDPDLAEAHFTLALLRFYYEYDFEGAKRSFDRALELHPGFSEAHHSVAAYHSIHGDHAAALAAVHRARAIDPVSTDIHADVGWYHYFARDLDAAIEASEHTLELDPDSYWARLCLHFSLVLDGQTDRAVAETLTRLERHGLASDELRALADTPDRFLDAYWQGVIDQLAELGARTPVSPSASAPYFLLLGRDDEALAALERSFEERSGWILPFLPVDPLYDGVRGDARFVGLVERIRGAGKR